LLGKEKNIGITYDIEKLYLPIDLASPICLLINEVLVNSIKHAFAEYNNSKIVISLHQKNNQVELVIKDNGKGFNYEEERSKGPSLGLEIIETLSEQLGGKAEFLNEEGTTFRLSIPLPK
jgi:two-component sensor histidine kinase